MARNVEEFCKVIAQDEAKSLRRELAATDLNVEPIVKLWVLRCLVHNDLVRSEELGRRTQYRLYKSLNLDIDLNPTPEFESLSTKQAQSIHHKLEQELMRLEAQAESIGVSKQLRANVLQLAELLGLSEIDQEILEFAVYVHSNSVLKSFEIPVQDAECLAKIMSIALDRPLQDVARSIKPASRLLKTGMLSIDPRSYSNLPSVLELFGSSFVERITTDSITPYDVLKGRVDIAKPTTLSLPDYAHVQTPIGILIPFLRQAIAAHKPGVNILIYGCPGTGKTELSRLVASLLDCNLFEVSSEDEDGDSVSGSERWRSYCVAQNLFKGQNTMIAFDEAEDVFGSGGMASLASLFGMNNERSDKVSKAWINKKLEDNEIPTLWISNSVDGIDPAYIRRFDMVFEVPIPPKHQRLTMLKKVCHDTIGDKQLEQFASIKTLAPAIAARSAAVIRTIGDKMPDAEKSNAFQFLIENTLQAQGHHTLSLESPLPAFYDPAFINAHADLAAVADGLKSSGSARLCLFGPPGTGKTGYGRWLAEYLEKPLLIKKVSDLMSAFVGENEKNIAKAFREATAENAILMIDEVDSFLQDRQNAQRSWETTLVNEMLTQIESFNGIFIASTNLMDGLDPAALRRFDIKVMFDYLKPTQAIALAERHCAQMDLQPLTHDDLAELSHLRFLTPGDFAAAARQHRFKPYASSLDLIKVLSAECKLKKVAHPAIGFCH